MKKLKLLPVMALALSACAPNNFEGLNQIANNTATSIGCYSFESKTWDAINGYLVENNEIPDAEAVKEHLRTAFKDLKTSKGSLSEEQLETLSEDIEKLFDLFLVEAPNKEKVQNAQELLTVLTALELGDHTTQTKVELQSKVETQFAKIKSSVGAMQVTCANPGADIPDQQVPSSPIETNAGNVPLALFGANWTMATAYQTCQALTEPIMTSSTPDVKGIVITGNHKQGGKLRKIASVSSVINSHPYYKNINSYGGSCVNMQASPMIYDFGGKPYTTDKAGAELNYFKNFGSGTTVYGTDCSGFVFTALATAGLRFKPSVNVKPLLVMGTSATMFMNPDGNKWGCFKKITVRPQETIKSGDIISIPGHVVMVDRVGADPFGINNASSASECEKLSTKNFDFAVIQSSPSKDAVGINRYDAADYLTETSTMRTGLQRYAYYSCLARFNNKSYTPDVSKTSVIRHTGTPECRGTRVALTAESCIQNCPQLAR